MKHRTPAIPPHHSSYGDPMLETAIQAARCAGEEIVRRYPLDRDITAKGFRDLVTDADMAAQQVIVERLHRRFPEHDIVSEEARANHLSGEYTWIIDPLDGTTNYAHHHPVFAVSVGLLRHGEPFLGVVHNPLSEETFAARQGAGATVNDQPIRVSATATLQNAMVAMDWGHNNEMRKQMLGCAGLTLLRCGTLRVIGSAALALAYVASGRLDAYFQTGLKPWDVAAGILLVREAGGRCTTRTGMPYRIDRPDCLATNHRIHDELLPLVGAGGPEGKRP